MSQRLRLIAEDTDDLRVISAALQDAVAQVGDIRFEAKARQLTVELNRFRWEAAKGKKGGERVRSALRLSSILSVQAKRLRREPKDAVVALLSVDFQPGAAPGGAVVLTFAGGGELRCEAECVDALLLDVSDPWPTKVRPEHGAVG